MEILGSSEEGVPSTAGGLVVEEDGLKRLAEFGAWCARRLRDSLGDIDGADAQEAMERLGVIEKRMVDRACGDGCVCADHGPFPHECFRFSDCVESIVEGCKQG